MASGELLAFLTLWILTRDNIKNSPCFQKFFSCPNHIGSISLLMGAAVFLETIPVEAVARNLFCFVIILDNTNFTM